MLPTRLSGARRSRHFSSWACWPGIVLMAGAPAFGQMALRAVAASGTPAPGGSGVLFSAFGTPALNMLGTLAFKAELGAAGEGIVVGTSGQMFLVAASGQTPPATGDGVHFTSFDAPTINDTGVIAFSASIAGGDVTFESNRVVVSGAPGSLALMARTGASAPGTFNEEVFYSFDTVRLGQGGHVAVYATLDGPFVDTTNHTGAWIGVAPGALVLGARAGDLVGPTIPGTLFTSVGIPSVNAAGALAFTGIIAGSGVSSTNDQVTFRGAPGALAVALREGAQAADAATGVRYAAFGAPGLNALGRVALSGSLRGTGVTTFNDAAAWSDAGGAWVQVVRSGLAAPGIPNTNVSVPGFPRINAHGRVVLLSALTGPTVNPANDLALWSDVNGTLELVSRKGDPAPGAGAGVNIGGFGPAAINAQGIVVFKATLVGTGVSAANDSAVFAWDRLGTRMVARTGVPVLVSGIPRTPTALNVALDSGLQDGRACSLSERGVLAVGMTCTDGSAVVATVSLTRCPADLVSVGGAPVPDAMYTLDDLLAFINAVSEGDLFADLADVGGTLSPDGQLTLDDLLAFINAFGEACAY